MNLKEYDFTSLVKECKEIREKIQYKDIFEFGYYKYYLSARDMASVFLGKYFSVQACCLWYFCIRLYRS